MTSNKNKETYRAWKDPLLWAIGIVLTIVLYQLNLSLKANNDQASSSGEIKGKLEAWDSKWADIQKQFAFQQKQIDDQQKQIEQNNIDIEQIKRNMLTKEQFIEAQKLFNLKNDKILIMLQGRTAEVGVVEKQIREQESKLFMLGFGGLRGYVIENN